MREDHSLIPLQWALQTDRYILNWQFDFGTQLNWSSVEANWQLSLDSSCAKNIEIVEAAAFVPEKRGARPGAWADGKYTGMSFDQVCMTAMDLREEQNDARMERQLEEANARGHAHDGHADADPVPDEATTVDMSSLVHELAGLVDAAGDSDSDSSLPGLPSYAESRAQHEEETGRTMSEDDTDSEERKAAAARKKQAVGRRRYILEEADDDDEE